MAFQAGEKLKVIVETPDGQVIDLTGLVVSMSVSTGFSDMASVEMSMVVPSVDFVIRSHDDWSFLLGEMRSAPEWKCDYCGGVNLKKHRKCESCGAHRTFLYD